jgi:uronate dehydrogenase
MVKKKVLILGATGRIGPSLLEELNKHQKDYEIILGIHRKKILGYRSRKVNLQSISQLKSAFKGISVVVNLAAESDPKAPFKDIIQPNLIGSYNILEAARLAKVKRVVMASSVHAIRGYKLSKTIKETQAPKPLNFYGASKVFLEALCHVFSTKYNLSCLAIRIGAYIPDNKKKAICLTRDNLDYVISQRDLGQLIDKCIQAPSQVKYGILAGSSNNKHLYMDLSSAKKLVNYHPKDDAFKMCEDIKK